MAYTCTLIDRDMDSYHIHIYIHLVTAHTHLESAPKGKGVMAHTSIVHTHLFAHV